MTAEGSLPKDPATLRDILDLQENLLFSLSHDLKTPPVVVQGFAELLLRGRYGQLTPEQEKPVQTIYRNIATLSEMVDQLLDFSRLLKKVHAPHSAIPLGQAWSSECAGFGKAGHVLASFSPCTVEGDDTVSVARGALQYALRNMACNALRLACPGTHIGCAVRSLPDGVHLNLDFPAMVEDHPSFPRLLDSMFQPSSSALADAGLNGTGLAAARYLAALMGGNLSCEEFDGDRGRFSLMLPAAPNHP